MSRLTPIIAPIIAIVQRDFMADIQDCKLAFVRLVVQPAVYIFVFGYLMGDFFKIPQGNYNEVLVPGIIAIAVMNGSFSNVGGAIASGYYFRCMEGWLLTPLSLRSLMAARIISGVLYGTASGGIVIFLAWMIVGIMPTGITILFLMIISGSLLFSLLTIVMFLTPVRPDKGQELFSFLLMPMTFFGCTFYSYFMLKAPFSYIALLFPTTYISEGLRAAYNPHMPHMDAGVVLAGLLSGLALLFYAADRVFHRRFRDFLW